MLVSKTLLGREYQWIVQDFSKKQYYHFNNAIEMLSWYLSIPDDMRFHNEVIFDTTQKMRLDIDSKELLPLDQWNKILKTCHLLMKKYTKDGNLAVFDMSDDTKKSCHMICTNRAFESNEACKELCMKIRSEMEDLAKYVDTSVYNKIQHFRMYGSRKPNTQRYKICTFSDEPNFTIMHTLLGFTEGLEIIKVDIPDKPTSDAIVNSPIEVISKWCHIRHVDGNRIDLTRTKPSYCETCKRIHESENPFLVIGYKYAFLHCRRSIEGKSTKYIIVDKKVTV